MKLYNRTIAPIALAVAAMAAPAAADAAHGDETYRIRVHYHAGELAGPDGAASVYDRIVRAARRTCGGVGRISLVDRSLAQACRRELVARAVARVGDPMLAAMHQGPTILGASR